MKIIRNARSRWLAATLTALGASVLLSACGSPVSPTVPLVEPAAATNDDGGRAAKSGSARANLVWCPRCPLSAIEPPCVPGTKEILCSVGLSNIADAPTGDVRVAASLVSAARRRITVTEMNVAAPRPGETLSLRLRLAIPSSVPTGRYMIELVADPRNEIPESDESDNVWVSDESLFVP
jgi:hypothetical protein